MTKKALFAAAMFAAILAGCPSKPKPDRGDASVARSDGGAQSSAILEHLTGDPARGKELVGTYQCNRCHSGTGHAAPPENKDCVGCHDNIMQGKFKAPAASITKWKPRVKEYDVAPSLEATNKRFSRQWVESYLLQPTDLRPHLHQYMPRLTYTAQQAKDIAAYLVPDDPASAPKAEPLKADLGKGRQLLETKGCGSCHVMTGVAALPASNPPAMEPREFDHAHKLAPDLRFARDRMSAPKMTAWLKDPKAVKADSAMPKIELTPAEINDIVGYLTQAEITPPAKPERFKRLPALDRKVTFKEVDEKVFHRTCWHCHSEPDYAIGDGGPGNSGGFGFKPRGLNLSDYNGITAGDIDDKGERQSIFAKDDQGMSRLVAALVARHDEEELNVETGKVRGMPLGYDALSAEEIQLVESWVAQGRPR
ncbi:MAG: c-type cytochrome [Labilithrix sp.]